MRVTRNLHAVTITGADDAVDPSALAELSRAFPFVEWGILHSDTRRGTSRYPSDRWLCEIVQLSGYRGLKLSAHLCGKLARDVLFGAPGWALPDPRAWQRVQLNGFSDGKVYAQGAELSDRLHRCFGTEVIYQCADARAAQVASMLISENNGRGGILIDASGGRGVRAPHIVWPAVPGMARVGYAGGIAPDNVVETCEALAAYPEKTWIDLESGARTDDKFDLDKVHAVLESCLPYVAEEKLAQ